jgi:hypothetical protein
MNKFQKVYILWANKDDSKPLFIDHNQDGIDAQELDAYYTGSKPIASYKIANFIIKNKPKEMVCDCFIGLGPLMISKRLLNLTNVFDSFKKFPVQVNGEDFSALTIDKVTDCFDKENSIYVKYDEADVMMGSIAEYTFFTNKVDAENVFAIPEYHYLYCTDVVKNKIEQLSTLGFTFIEVYDVTTGRVPIN